MSKENSCCQDSSSGFIFGLICGAVIGAFVAILIYKNNKTEVFENLSKKIKDFFHNLVSEEKKPKSRPKIVTSSSTTPLKPKKPIPKTFIKPKR